MCWKNKESWQPWLVGWVLGQQTFKIATTKNCHHFFFFFFTFWATIISVSHSGGRGAEGSYKFFRNPPHQNWYPPWGIPPLKNEAPHLKNNLPPLKHEAPYHEMIPRKCTINNDWKTAYNPSKICVNKFIFNKFPGLLAYSHQLYYQMNTFTGIFWQHFKSLFPYPPSNFEESLSPPNVLNSCGKPWLGIY